MPDRAKQIQQVHQLCHRAWSKQARDAGLSFSEFEYLSAVQAEADRLRYEDSHGQHLQDIVDALGVTKASASTMISKLEDRGLVERFQCKKDARAQHIVLTREGQIKLAGGTRIYESVVSEVEELLSKS
ncbi:MarR family transcriptional regulator [Shimia isoporae]|uniref:MarR family transcriptional regulator n=1 Tax=Shimia isoporae TaxID=647720 RepID=A0A4R1NIU0_9RHOB|nr:MarR family transcriptional regulator [Shimia isoporae]TCL08024.1 MarR family transcriptional regulator [Shimia isoporae]